MVMMSLYSTMAKIRCERKVQPEEKVYGDDACVARRGPRSKVLEFCLKKCWDGPK
jgi:hypothetical protein